MHGWGCSWSTGTFLSFLRSVLYIYMYIKNKKLIRQRMAKLTVLDVHKEGNFSGVVAVWNAEIHAITLNV